MTDLLTPQPRSLLVARRLSVIFHPLITAVASCVLAGVVSRVGALLGLGWSLLALAIQFGPSMLIYTIRKRQGAYSDGDVSVRQERYELYIVGTVFALLATLALRLLGAPPELLALSIASVSVGIICGIINLFWKISMHAATVGALATVAALFVPILGALLWICALAVGWARVRTGNHTPLQVLAGLAVSAIVVTASMALVAGVV